ncbi:NAD(P)/FAD-dependent oxidoreductase [Epilithonimonas hungarica]|uniref:Thioredoxin reductase n=1 Tax=Epilithonimonas hungarica TaxID=454006 RepID=A0A1G7M8Z0_9FLAO|nr:NAD(P)/FAD-dependent oxidoreductase [Epilithonimonas hungarica]SDF58064.1 Thioredoxin reductase [Epilithonimonas hungarica]
MENQFDVIIVGGSYAGLSAAMSLGRSLRKVLVIDSGKPCNIQTPHSHNFLTQDGKTPKEISTIAKGQVKKYATVEFCDGLAMQGKKTENGFEISTRRGEIFEAKKLIFATGIVDEVPNIKGFWDCWGISLIHCPYCHGYEFKNKKTGIIANGERGFHISSLVNNLTDDLTILTRGKADFTEEQFQKLEKNNIKIIETEIDEIQHQNGNIETLILSDGEKLDFDAVYGAFHFKQHSDIPGSLGCEFTENGHIKIDNKQNTTVPGVYACGDNSCAMRSVANAAYTGNLTGAMVNMDLTNEGF